MAETLRRKVEQVMTREPVAQTATGDELFASGGFMAALMREKDWAATQLGPVHTWPQSLRTALGICLHSDFPIAVLWGPELVMLYNDAYRPILGSSKHPRALGERVQLVFAEVWDVVGPMLEEAFREGRTTRLDDRCLVLDRKGYLEECFFTLSNSPIRDDAGRVGGVFCVAKETTEQVSSERCRRAHPSPQGRCPDTSTARILVADDDADMREYVTRLLREQWTVTAVADGQQALEIARRDRPELILSDVMMPGLDGFELLRELRADPRTATTSVILLSARAGEEFRVEGLEAGADDCLAKPFAARELLARVGATLTLARVRQESEAAVRATVERYRAFIEQTADAVWRAELDEPMPISLAEEDQIAHFYAHSHLAECNDAMARMHGFDAAAEPVGARLGDFLPRSDPANVDFLRAFIRAGYRLTDVEANARDQAGRPRHFLVNLVGIVQDGHLRHAWGSQRDITERKRAELFLDSIVENIPGMVFVKDARTLRFVLLNRACEEFVGVRRSELLGKTDYDFYPVEEADFFTRKDREVLAVRRLVDIPEERAHTRGSGERILHTKKIPVLGPEGDPQYLLGISEDITERKRGEAALRESEARLRLAQQAGGIGIWEWDVATNTMHYSPDFLTLLGLPPDAPPPTRQDWHARIIHPDDEARVDQEVWAAVDGPRPFDTEFRVHWPNGEEHWLAVRAQLVRDAADAPVRMVGVTFDVTARRRAEEHLRRMDRMESVGRLAGGVAHEVNNQMAVVLACADFILTNPGIPDDVRQDAEFIRQAAERSAGITKQLLAFSRRHFTDPEALDLNVVVAGFAPVLRRALPEGTTLVLREEARPGWVHADKGQLEQVLLNLVLNAADAMPDSGGTVTIVTATAELDESYGLDRPDDSVRPGRYAALMVSDTGHGMGRETMSRAFEPFFTTKARGKGTGLGLSSVYGIVKQGGGYVWLDSQVGLGTTVKVYLPLVDAAPPRQGSTPEPPRARAVGTVLVADDDASVRRAMVRSLRREGYTVLEAADGQDALDIIQSNAGPVDLVLTDIAMPVMGGRELIQRLREIRPGVPVLAISGYTDDEIIRRGLMADETSFIAKPFSARELAARVRAMVDGRRGEMLLPE